LSSAIMSLKYALVFANSGRALGMPIAWLIP
jgi:hypothetical protein